MNIRTFRVPFDRIVGPEAAELEFGPDDYLVVRPLFAQPAGEVGEFGRRLADVSADTPDKIIDQLILDIIVQTVMEWHLAGPDGVPIAMPATQKALNALPAALRGSLIPFLSGYRGDVPVPTTRV